MTTETRKPFDIQNAARDLWHNNSYMCMTDWVSYIVHQPGFYEDDPDLPLTYSEIERKPKEDGEEDGEENEFDFFEAYAVTDWLADQLYERGEWVSRPTWRHAIWFRHTTGQACYMDGVIQEITIDSLLKLGQISEDDLKTLEP